MVVLGRLTVPYGVRGWIKVFPMGDDPAAWAGMPEWWLSRDPDGNDWQCRDLTAFRQHGKGWIAKLAGVEDRSAAEALDGLYFAAPREALPETATDEYYWGDLLGLAVVNAQGIVLGVVADLIGTAANDVLVVRIGEGKDMKERLLPFIGPVVKGVDIPGRVIHVEWDADW